VRLAALLLVVAAGGCASGAKRFTVRLSQNDIVGRSEAVRQVDAALGLIPDEPLAGYLQSVGSGLGFPQVTFAILNSESPNAYALDNGVVFVSRGMLALVNDEGELAAVLGHEVGHIASNHGKKRQLATLPFDVIGKTLKAILSLMRPSFGTHAKNASDASARVVAIVPLSRSQERRADEAGVELAAAAGYDPLALSELLTRLATFVDMGSSSWLDDHPPVADRNAHMRKLVAEERLPAAPKRRDALLPMLDGLVVGESPLDGAALGPTVVHPRFGVVYEVPKEWSTEREGSLLVSSGEGCTVLLEGSASSGAPAEVMRRSAGEGRVEQLPVEENLTKLTQQVARGRAEAADVHVELIVFGDERRSRVLSGAWPVEAGEVCAKRFAPIVASLRPVTAADIANLPVTRLRVVMANAEEPLTHVLARTACPWTPERVAALNGLDVDHVFMDPEPVKVPRREVWEQR
jgi:predicted Zn-dependent protease